MPRTDQLIRQAAGGTGRTLDPGTRTDMENRLGHRFGDVRVHTDDAADAAARSVRARAYTVGSHVIFSRGEYAPTTTEGRRTLAHELMHTVQQRGGQVAGRQHHDGVWLSDPADRFEQAAEAAAERALAGPASAHLPAAPPGQAGPHLPGSHPVIQRRERTGPPVAPSGATPRPPGVAGPATGRPSPETRTPHDVYVIDFGVNRDVVNWREAVMHIGEIEAESVDQMVRDVKSAVGDPATNCLRRLTLDGHGSPGNMSVGDGTGWVEGRNISTGHFRPSLADLTPYFCDGAQVTLLGCNVGRGAIGARFIQTLSDYWQVNVAAATGLVRGYGIEGVWVWGIPGQILPNDALLISDQIVRIFDTSPLGDDEEMIFDLLDAGSTVLGAIRAELVRLGKWDGIKTNLRDEDRARFDRLFPAEP